MIIALLGIILIGTAYWYFNRAPEAPSRLPARPRAAKTQSPKPLTPIEPPERKPQPVKPPAAPEPPAPEPKQAKPLTEVPAPEAEAPAEAPPKAPPQEAKPAETPKPGETRPEFEKPSPPPVAKTTVPAVEPARPFSIQVASLVVKRNALALRKRLEKLGYRPTIRKVTVRLTRHRVYAGEFHDREEADQVARRLRTDGFSPKLVAGKQGQFAVEVGSFFIQNDAIDVARRLQLKNYPSKIVAQTAPTPVYAVRVEAYEKPSEAREDLKALKRKGFTLIIVRLC